MRNSLFLLLILLLSEQSIATVTTKEVAEQKEIYNTIDDKIKLFEKDIAQSNINTNTVLTISSIVLTVAALFGIGGPIAIFIETKYSQRKYKNMISDFNKEKEKALISIQENLQNFRVEFDQNTRIIRLGKMLIERNYDDDIFYADLRQLETRPNYLMMDIVTQILENHRSRGCSKLCVRNYSLM